MDTQTDSNKRSSSSLESRTGSQEGLLPNSRSSGDSLPFRSFRAPQTLVKGRQWVHTDPCPPLPQAPGSSRSPRRMGLPVTRLKQGDGGCSTSQGRSQSPKSWRTQEVKGLRHETSSIPSLQERSCRKTAGWRERAGALRPGREDGHPG